MRSEHCRMSNDGENRERAESGEFVRSRDPEDVLMAMNPGDPYVVSELAEEMDWPRRTVGKLLNDLHDADRVQKVKKNARVVLWIRPGDE